MCSFPCPSILLAGKAARGLYGVVCLSHCFSLTAQVTMHRHTCHTRNLPAPPSTSPRSFSFCAANIKLQSCLHTQILIPHLVLRDAIVMCAHLLDMEPRWALIYLGADADANVDPLRVMKSTGDVQVLPGEARPHCIIAGHRAMYIVPWQCKIGAEWDLRLESNSSGRPDEKAVSTGRCCLQMRSLLVYSVS